MPPIDSPDAAVAAMIERLTAVPTELIETQDAAGMVLAQEIVTDRPSPPASVSAMDGYAIRAQDASLGTLPVAGEAKIGRAPPRHGQKTATRIYTGSPVPVDADSVIKREDVTESQSAEPDQIEISPDVASGVQLGRHIRFEGENAPAGTTVLRAGDLITPPAIGALVSFGVARVEVYRQVGVGVLVTGDELADVGDPIDQYMIRDSNGPAVRATIDAQPWAWVNEQRRVKDDEASLELEVRSALSQSDAVVLTGGVSMGRYDFVPGVLEKLGCEIVFHKLPQRPGRPMLGAIGPSGQAILALPGNPVSVLCTLHRLGLPILRKLAGFNRPEPRGAVILEAPMRTTIPLWWYRPVRMTGDGKAILVEHMGSGDVASISGSDGFVQLSPNATEPGPWPFWAWQT